MVDPQIWSLYIYIYIDKLSAGLIIGSDIHYLSESHFLFLFFFYFLLHYIYYVVYICLQNVVDWKQMEIVIVPRSCSQV